MYPMPTPRPAPALAKGGSPRTKHHRAPFRPGALLRIADGQTFRVAKDGTRIHYADSNNKRNVVHLTDALGARPSLPDGLIREMLSRFAEVPTWAQAHRNWRAHRDEQGSWTLALELRGGPHGRLAFPLLTDPARPEVRGVPFDPANAQSFCRIVTHLWSAADMYEKDPSAPADLTAS